MKILIANYLTAVFCLFIYAPCHSQHKANKTLYTDPVCQLMVTKGDSYSLKYNKKRYYFDSDSCRMAFKQEPEAYLIRVCVPNNNITDPVCGVKVDLTESFAYTYSGKVYQFHSEHCRKSFISTPERYLKKFCMPEGQVEPPSKN